jgi:hypothetical protein
MPRDQDASATSGGAPTPPRPDDPSGAGASAVAPPGSPTATGRAHVSRTGTSPTSAGQADRNQAAAEAGRNQAGAEAGRSQTAADEPSRSQAGAGGADPSRPGAGSAGSNAHTRPGSSRADRIAGATADAGSERRQRRRRWLLLGGIAAGAAVLVIALCAGLLIAVAWLDDFRDDTSEAHERRELRDAECLALEERLNRLTPPGATTTPQARATAVRDENAAVRIYVDGLRDPRSQDTWRQLLDARTAYAEALDRQARARTPAFFVAPRDGDGDGRGVADELIDSSPAPCAGPVRRLAAPDI